MKFLKIGLAFLSVGILLVIVAAAVFVATFDANDYRPQISEQVKLQTGRDFELLDIKPSVFPWIGIELQQLTLANAEGFSDKEMLKIDRLDVKVELLPLVKQEIHIDTLRLHGLELSLAKNEQGRTNWDDILEAQSKDESESQMTEPQPDKTITDKTPEKKSITEKKEKPGKDPLAALLVNGIEIKDARVKWQDKTSNQVASLEKLNLLTGSFQLGKVLPITLTTDVALSEPEARFNVELKSGVKFDPQTQLLDLPELMLQIVAIGDVFPNGKMKVNLDTQAAINLKQQTVNVPELSLKTLGLELQANTRVTQFQTAPNVQGQLELLPFNARDLTKKLAISLPPMSNVDSLKQLAMKTQFQATTDTAKLSALNFQLDKSTLAGDLSVNQFSNPVIAFNLNLDRINLDDYLPPPVEEKNDTEKSEAKVKQGEAEKTSTAKTEDIKIELPVELIRTLNVKGDFQLATVQVMEQVITDVLVQIDTQNGIADISKIRAKLLEGEVDASAKLDVTKKQPRYEFMLNAKGLKADSLVTPVLQDLSGKEEVALKGAADLSMNVTTKGEYLRQLKAGSNGSIKLHVGKAELHGIDANYFVREAVAGYLENKKQSVPASLRSQYQPEAKTALKVARATAKIKNGVVTNKDLLLDSSRFKITGAGQVVLHKETIDYRAVIDLEPNTTKTTVEKMLDVPVPVLIKGSFSQPAISVENKTWVKSIGKAIAADKKRKLKQRADKKKQEKIDKVETKVDEKKEELKDELEDKLKGLFR